MTDESAAQGCLLLILGTFVALAWAFACGWHFWGPR